VTGCYGIVKVPEGSWYCARCEASASDAQCMLCPMPRGALKRTHRGGETHTHLNVFIVQIGHMSYAHYIFPKSSLAMFTVWILWKQIECQILDLTRFVNLKHLVSFACFSRVVCVNWTRQRNDLRVLELVCNVINWGARNIFTSLGMFIFFYVCFSNRVLVHKNKVYYVKKVLARRMSNTVATV
jgi:hypothetical protein